jgi:uncharacterized protein YjbI with pentapeptide repeats
MQYGIPSPETLAFFAVYVAAFVVGSILWWFVPILQRRCQDSRLEPESKLSARDLADLEDQYRKTLSQVLGTCVLLFTVYIAFEQFKEARHKNEVDNTNARLAKGYDLVGADKAAQRTGGIHLLMEWAREGTEGNDRLDIVAKTLVSLVRERARFGEGHQPTVCEEFRRPAAVTIGPDIQQAIDSLIQASEQTTVTVNFRELNLSRAELSFPRTGPGKFAAGVPGHARFKGFNLAYADLTGAELHDLVLNKDVTLTKADFYCANLSKADVFSADLSGSNMAGANLSGASISKAVLAGVDLAGAVLENTKIQDVNLIHATLSNAKLFGVSLKEVKLEGALVDNTCFIGVKVGGSNLTAKDLQDTVTNSNPPIIAESEVDLPLDSPCRRTTGRVRSAAN